MKIHKKSAIAIVIAVIVLLVIGSCAAAQAAPGKKGCVSPREWRTMIWNNTPNENAAHFGTSGQVLKINVQMLSEDPVNPETNAVPFEMDSMLVRYAKCGHWGSHRFVKIWYVGWWETSKVANINKLDTMQLGWAQS